MATRTVSVALVADVGSYVSGMARASTSTKAFGSQTQQIGQQTSRGFDLAGKSAVLLGGAALAAGVGLKSVIGAASDLNETLNKSNVIFGNNAAEIEKWASNSARDFGMSKQAALEAAASLGNMFQQLGFAGDEAVNASENVVKLAADLGSFNNLETGDVLERIQAAFRGEYDSLQLLIPNINAARVESEAMAETGKENAKQLTAQEKAAAVLAIVNKDGAAAANDFAETSDGLANSTKIAAAEFEDLKSKIGQAFLPAAMGAMHFLSDTAIPVLGGLFDVVKSVAGAFGDLPGPVQAAIAAYAALALLRNPVSSAIQAIAFNAKVAAGLMAAATGATTGWTVALGAARIGVVSLISAAAPLAAAIGVAYAVREVVNFDSATDDARESVEALGESVKGLPVGEQIRTYREEIERLTEMADSVDNQGLFNKYVWKNPFTNEFKDAETARESIEQLQAQIVSLKDTTPTSMETVAEAVKGAATAAVEQSEEAQKALEDWLKAVQGIEAGFIDPLATYTGLLEAKSTAERESAEATAAATESGTDSWEDYVTDVSVSLDELATKLEEQLLAQDNWHANLATVAQRAGLDVAQALQQMGEDGVQLTAQMADGTDAEMQRMADLIREDTRRGTEGAAAELDQGLKVMAAIGAAGAGATASAIAKQLHLGVTDVQRIAGNYGVALATGINPVLGALGKRQVSFNGRGMPEYDVGGYTGPGGRKDPAGIVHAGEVVWSQDDVAAHGGPQRVDAMRRSRNGYASGGFVTAGAVPRPYSTAPYQMPISTAGDATMQKGFDEVRAWLQANAASGPVGAGAAGGSWPALWAQVHGQFPAARLTSSYRPGDPGYHGRGKAIDVAGARPGDAAAMLAINRWAAATMGGNLAELIHTPGINLWHGKPHTYNAATRADHYDHVHLAAYEKGTNYVPETGMALLHKGEAVIPANLNPRSREFSGGGGYGGGTSVIHRREVQITAVAAPNEEALARRIVDRQRDLEFLHG